MMMVELEDADAAIDQHRHLGPGIGGGEGTIGAASPEALGQFELEGHAFFPERDLDLLGIGGERVFVEKHG